MMARSAREAQPTAVDVVPIERPFSNFGYIEREFEGLATLRRIMSQVRQHDGRTMVVEDLQEAEDLRQEDEDIAKRFPGFRGSRARRLSFFTKLFKTTRGLSSATAEDFLGYVVVKTDPLPDGTILRRIYESVLRPSKHP
ncbi:MAG: hypothetical protein KAX19_05800, partial [Candidatus Brocadiae bacterium]|nr:hypothetical protein [Candidatus Brocadiia bacterium]